MATIAGTIQGVDCQHKTHSGIGDNEVWLITVDFGAYTGSADTATVLAVGAAINATTRDGKTRTLRWAAPAHGGPDTADQAVYFTGASVHAATISTDDLTGELSDDAGTEITTSTASTGVGLHVGISVS